MHAIQSKRGRPGKARRAILDAALRLFREAGYTGTTVDDLCAAAGVTKGAFFHHFASKEDVARAAADHWSDVTGQFFQAAPYHEPADPLDRVLAYLEFRKSILSGELSEFTCLAGTLLQETYGTHPAVREACGAAIFAHAHTLEADIGEAMARAGVTAISAHSLALYTQAVLQGAFILAKAEGGPNVAADCVDHLIRYVRLLFSK